MNHVIYHRADYDGLLSAAVILHFIPDAILHPWDHGDPVPEIPVSCTALYMADVAVSELMADSRLIWIDHHKTAIDKWGGNVLPDKTSITRLLENNLSNGADRAEDFSQGHLPGIRIDGVAACRLCWQWFSGNESIVCALDRSSFERRVVTEPLVLTLAGEYDVWDLHDERAIWLQHGLATYSHDPHKLCHLFSESMGGTADSNSEGDAVRMLIESGRVIEGFQQKEAANVLTECAYIREWEGLRWLILNTARGNSRSFPSTADRDDIDALMVWRFDGRRFIFSLYHKLRREDLDLSLIAVKYDGGGHRGACGFSLSPPEALEIVTRE